MGRIFASLAVTNTFDDGSEANALRDVATAPIPAARSARATIFDLPFARVAMDSKAICSQIWHPISQSYQKILSLLRGRCGQREISSPD